jgi:hypothetical protein
MGRPPVGSTSSTSHALGAARRHRASPSTRRANKQEGKPRSSAGRDRNQDHHRQRAARTWCSAFIMADGTSGSILASRRLRSRGRRPVCTQGGTSIAKRSGDWSATSSSEGDGKKAAETLASASRRRKRSISTVEGREHGFLRTVLALDHPGGADRAPTTIPTRRLLALLLLAMPAPKPGRCRSRRLGRRVSVADQELNAGLAYLRRHFSEAERHSGRPSTPIPKRGRPLLPAYSFKTRPQGPTTRGSNGPPRSSRYELDPRSSAGGDASPEASPFLPGSGPRRAGFDEGKACRFYRLHWGPTIRLPIVTHRGPAVAGDGTRCTAGG